MSLFLF